VPTTAIASGSAQLPATGAGTAWRAAIGFALIAVGAGLMMISRARPS
jgi:LPXTG-motif cell wall-anchored protein